MYAQFTTIPGIRQMLYPGWLAVNTAASIPHHHQRGLSSITPWLKHTHTYIESVGITSLTYSTALPPHFHGSDLPLYNTSERRGIQYPNSSTISETRTHPTICNCGEICLLVFSCHVIISVLIVQFIKESINVSKHSKCLCAYNFNFVFPSFILAARLNHWLDDLCLPMLNT